MSIRAIIGHSAVPSVRIDMPFTSPDASVEPAPGVRTDVDRAIARAQAFLLNHQEPSGFWWGELESNPTMEAEFVFFTHFLGIGSASRWTKIQNWILSRQGSDGGWNLYHGAPSDLSTSCECYLALKMTGLPADSPELQRAKAFILSKGGIDKARVFTKIWFALLGEWDWNGTPFLPPEMMLIPNRLPFSIYQFAMWSRATIVPMSILLSVRPIHPVAEYATVDELFLNGREDADLSLPAPSGLGIERLLYTSDRLLKLSNRLPWNPARSRALRAAENWIRNHQEGDGSWGGIQPPWVYSLMALHVLGYPNNHEVMQKGLKGFDLYAIEDESTWRLQASISPSWDACLSINALLDSGFDPDHPAVVRGVDWLIDRQIHTPGDWQMRARGVEPGGWSFMFQTERYPDTDDAAEVLLAIGRGGASDAARQRDAVKRGMRWVLAMQSRNGGWGAYDKDNTSVIVTKMPFFDFGETIDPPSVDVTAHILEMLAKLGAPLETDQVAKALEYIWSEQEEDGCWFGRWGVNYIYGTGSVLPALEAVGHDMTDPRVQRAADWLESMQNADGGWGESCASYANPKLRGVGESTASQTSWALMGLVSACRSGSEAARRGVAYLMRTQGEDGGWEEAAFTGTGFPGYGVGERRFRSVEDDDEEVMSEELPAGFMIKYHMYRIYWPLMGLGRYRVSQSQS